MSLGSNDTDAARSQCIILFPSNFSHNSINWIWFSVLIAVLTQTIRYAISWPTSSNAPRVYSTAESNIAKTKKKLTEEICLSGTPPKSIVLDPIAWVCTTSLYRWMTKKSWAKVDQNRFPPTMFHHRLCPSLPCFPQADIPSTVRPSIAVRLTKSRATSLFPQGPKNSQFSATGPWIRLSFFFFRPLLVWNAQWTECGFCPTM